jgi:acyl CoA:acetate/3-ketoacid CoA transferase
VRLRGRVAGFLSQVNGDGPPLPHTAVDQYGNVNVSRLALRPHVTAGCGGFVDITAAAA